VQRLRRLASRTPDKTEYSHTCKAHVFFDALLKTHSCAIRETFTRDSWRPKFQTSQSLDAGSANACD